MYLSRTESETWRVSGRKSQIFLTPVVFGAPPTVTLSHFHKDLCYRNRVSGIPFMVND